MRRTSASLTAAAVALAMISVPASAGSTDYLLELGGVEGQTQDDKHKNQIEILSYSWGATQTSHGTGAGGMGAGKVSMQDISAPSATSGAAKAKGEKGGTEDINIGVGELQKTGEAEITLKGNAGTGGAGKHTPPTVTLKRGTTAAAAGGVRVAVGDVTGDGAQAASGLPTGKRQHKPLMLSAPLAEGSVTVRGKFPGCAVGTRYPTIRLGNAARRYTLQDAIITSCATVPGGAAPMEEVSFNYAKIKT